jgi:hypothetical protein
MLDFNDSSLTQPAVLVTILTESVLRESLEKLLQSIKVYGYSSNEMPGAIKRMRQFGSISTETEVETYITVDLEMRVVVSAELANVIFYTLKEYRREFALFIYQQKIEALLE